LAWLKIGSLGCGISHSKRKFSVNVDPKEG